LSFDTNSTCCGANPRSEWPSARLNAWCLWTLPLGSWNVGRTENSQAADGDPLAPRWFPSLLALEIATARWPAKDTSGRELVWLGVTARPSAHWIARDRADPARRADCRSHAGDPSSGRTTPPVFQSVSFRQEHRLLGDAASRFWNHLSTEDDKILARMKIENFKRCLPQHYFNWPIDYPGTHNLPLCCDLGSTIPVSLPYAPSCADRRESFWYGVPRKAGCARRLRWPPVLKANPFRKAAPNLTVAIFLDGPPPTDALGSRRWREGRGDAPQNTRDLRPLQQWHREIQAQNPGRLESHGEQPAINRREPRIPTTPSLRWALRSDR
jgi:hypothetical protein